MKSVSIPILFLLLFNLLVQVARSDISDISERFGRKNESSSKGSDAALFRELEEEMLLLNKSGYVSRDKRALGILLQGFMEALGYTVSPLQLASIPNAAAPMPVGGGAASPPMGNTMMPAPGTRQAMPPAMMNASATTPGRQRETIRLTGLFNFGHNGNTSHLVNHLSQYEQMFHGNRSAASSAPPMSAAQPAPAIGPDIDPRSRPPLKEPLFVQIPLPIVPNLPPPQPPSPMPIDSSYHEGYSKDSSEEYSNSKDDEGQSGHFNEEDENSHDSDDFDYKYDKYDTPEERNYENKEAHDAEEQPKTEDKYAEEEYNDSDERPKSKENPVEKEYNVSDEAPKAIEKEYNDNDERPRPKEKHIHKVYKNNKNVENLTVENKEIRDPSEVSVEGPPGGSQFNHVTFVDEPNWKENQEEKIYKIAAEQEARAEALAEENAEREKARERNHNEEEEFHRNREKEIDEANEERDVSYQKKPYYDDEDEGSSEKEHYDEDERKYDEDEEKEATDHEENGTHRNEATTQLPLSPVAQAKNYNEDPDFYPATLPISYDRDKPPKNQTLRDSYGKSLEKPSGKVDDRVAEYITMFKDPQTGVYDPNRARQYEHARISFDHSDLIDGYNRIQKEYGSPENKYEEYEIDSADRVEHRSNAKLEDTSKESVVAAHEPTECSCSKKRKVVLETQETVSSERSVTKIPPTIASTKPEPGYGPYYSTVKYLYDPVDHDHGIITRLTTHESPTTVKLENHSDTVANRTTIIPTISPERPTTFSFFREAESEEFRAWPAPFDYLYDNSEPKIVYKKPPPAVSMPAPFKPTKPTTNNRHTLPFSMQRDKIKSTHRNASGESYKSDRDSKKPNSFHETRKTKSNEQISKREEYTPKSTATQATVHKNKKAKLSEQLNSREEYFPTYPATQATLHESRKAKLSEPSKSREEFFPSYPAAEATLRDNRKAKPSEYFNSDEEFYRYFPTTSATVHKNRKAKLREPFNSLEDYFSNFPATKATVHKNRNAKLNEQLNKKEDFFSNFPVTQATVHKNKNAKLNEQLNKKENYFSNFPATQATVHQNRNTKLNEQLNKREEYFPTFPVDQTTVRDHRKAKLNEPLNKQEELSPTYTITPASVYDQRKRPSNNDRLSNSRTNIKPPTRTPTLSDIITMQPERSRSTKRPRKSRKIPNKQPMAVKIGEPTIVPTIQVKYTYPHGPSQLGNVKEETTNYVQKGGKLVIPEPAPYDFNEGFIEFTEEPDKVADFRQHRREDPMQFLKFTRNL